MTPGEWIAFSSLIFTLVSAIVVMIWQAAKFYNKMIFETMLVRRILKVHNVRLQNITAAIAQLKCNREKDCPLHH